MNTILKMTLVALITFCGLTPHKVEAGYFKTGAIIGVSAAVTLGVYMFYKYMTQPKSTNQTSEDIVNQSNDTAAQINRVDNEEVKNKVEPSVFTDNSLSENVFGQSPTDKAKTQGFNMLAPNFNNKQNAASNTSTPKTNEQKRQYAQNMGTRTPIVDQPMVVVVKKNSSKKK